MKASVRLTSGTANEPSTYRIIRPMGTDNYLLTVTYGGAGVFRLGGRRVECAPGTACLVRPNTPHDYGTLKGEDRWEFVWAHFVPRPHWLDLLRWPEPMGGIGMVELDDEARQSVLDALKRMQANDLDSGARRLDFALNALELALLECDVANPSSSSYRPDRRIRRVMDYIARNVEKPHTVNTLAEKVGLSPSRFAYLFRQEVGIPPQRYLESLRLERACRLLEHTDHSVTKVAAQVGFECPFYFATRFRKRYDLSPMQYRHRAAGIEAKAQ